MKRPIATTLFLSAAAALSACGIRGDLERPPPIFSSAPPDEEARTPVAVPADYAAAPERPDNAPYYNDLGGEIPKADPAGNVDEAGLGEVSSN